MRHPYHAVICAGDAAAAVRGGFLVAACGPRLVAVRLTSREITSEWAARDAAHGQAHLLQQLRGERPVKKQKTADAAAAATTTTTKPPNIIKLAASPDGRHIVAATDDKCIRVFECHDGTLAELSRRCMPKRPCAVQVTPDGAAVLVADKFGDVYSLPLIPAALDGVEADLRPTSATPDSPRGFRVAANELTVHSKRNRMALEAQMKQKSFTARKEPLTFHHKLLLGHVSMLTDMKFATRHHDGHQRGYIITADRDEHIRISRAPPQAHVIEGYCLGHTQFVSSICPVGNTNLLLSGGGDDWIGVWDWLEFKLVKKISLKALVNSVVDPASNHVDQRLAVSGIWSAPLSSEPGAQHVMVIAVEKVKAIFLISSSQLAFDPGKESHHASPMIAKQLPGVPLDVTALRGRLLISLDVRDHTSARLGMVGVSSTSQHGTQATDFAHVDINDIPSCLSALNQHETRDEVSDRELDALFYGVAHLRKRGPQEDDDDDDAHEGAATEE